MYFKSRGLTGEIAKEFSIGYAPDGWQNLKIPFRYLSSATSPILIGVKNDKGK